jgi:hypothetical protein
MKPRKFDQVFWHKQAASFLRAAFAEVDKALAKPAGSSARDKALAQAKEYSFSFCLWLFWDPEESPVKVLPAIGKALNGQLRFPKPRVGPYDALIREASARAKKTSKHFTDLLPVIATQMGMKEPNTDAALRRAKALGCHTKAKPGRHRKRRLTS